MIFFQLVTTFLIIKYILFVFLANNRSLVYFFANVLSIIRVDFTRNSFTVNEKKFAHPIGNDFIY